MAVNYGLWQTLIISMFFVVHGGKLYVVFLICLLTLILICYQLSVTLYLPLMRYANELLALFQVVLIHHPILYVLFLCMVLLSLNIVHLLVATF